MLWTSPPENWIVAGLRIWLVLTARGGLALPSKWTQHESQCTRDTPSVWLPFFFRGEANG